MKVRYSLTENEKTKFVVPDKDSSAVYHKKRCFKYKGMYGGEWPTPQRGHWFPEPDDVTSFREKIKALCPFNDKSMVRSANTLSSNFCS